MSRTIRALAAFAILVALATQCGCAELTIAEARAQETSSVGSFAELTGEAPQTVTVGPSTAAVVQPPSLAVTPGPKGRAATSVPIMHFKSTEVLDPKLLSVISEIERSPGKQNRATPSLTAANAMHTSIVLGKEVARKREGETFHDRVTEQVGTFLIGLTKGTLIDEQVVKSLSTAGELRQRLNPFRVSSIGKWSAKSIFEARDNAKQTVSGLPRRFLGGNVKDVVRQFNENVASIKTMSQSLKSEDVKSLLTKVTENSAILEVLSKLPLDGIKAEIQARMHGAAPRNGMNKPNGASTTEFSIKDLVPKSLLDNMRKVGERARTILGDGFARKPAHSVARKGKGGGIHFVVDNLEHQELTKRTVASSFVDLMQSSTDSTCSARPLGSDVAITFKVSLGASALSCCMSKEDGGAGTDAVVDPSCGRDGVSMSLGINVAELVIVVPLDSGAPYFVLGSGAEAKVSFFESSAPDNYGKKGMQCKVKGNPFAKVLPETDMVPTFSVGFLRDHKRVWGGSWMLGLRSTTEPIVASPSTTATDYAVWGVDFHFTNHCGGGYSCAHSQPSCNMLPAGFYFHLDTATKTNSKAPPKGVPKLEVSFSWSWSWVLPTPSSLGWEHAKHTTIATDAVDWGLTKDAHFCNQRPWGIEALGCTNKMKLFQTLEDEFCEKASNKRVTPDPAKLGKRQRYKTYGCCKVTPSRPDARQDEACLSSPSFLELGVGVGVGARLRGTASDATPSIGETALAVTNSVIGMTPSKKRYQSAISRSDVELLLDYLKDGTLSANFCVGADKDCSEGNYFRAVQGKLRLNNVETVNHKSNTTAMGSAVKVSAKVPKIALGALAYLGANSVREDSGKEVLELLNSMRGLPLANSNLTIVVQGSNQVVDSLSITLRGSPPSSNIACTNLLSCAIKEKTKKNLSPVVQTLDFDGKKKIAQVTSAFTLKRVSTAGDRVVLEDEKGEGPTLFVSQRFAVKNMMRNARPTIGAKLGIKVCIEHCNNKKDKETKRAEAKRFLAFAGQLQATSDGLSAKGDVKMLTPWSSCFGSPFVHIDDGVGTLSVSLNQKPIGVSPMQVSASACFGSKAACVDGSSTHFYKGEAIARVNPNDSEKDFVAVMFADATLDKVFAIFGESISSRYETFRQKLPDIVRASGVHPSTTDKRCKKSPRDTKRLPSAIDLDCFARIAVSPHASQEVMGSVSIIKGYSLSGRLHLLGQSVRVAARFDSSRFHATARMDKPVVLDKIATIVHSASEPRKGPVLRIKLDERTDAAKSPAVTMTGLLQIPGLFVQARAVLVFVNGGIICKVPGSKIFGLDSDLSLEARIVTVTGQSSDSLATPDAKMSYKAKLRPQALATVKEKVEGTIAGQVDAAKALISELTNKMTEIKKNGTDICNSLQGMGKLEAKVMASCNLASAAVKAKTASIIQVAQRKLKRTRAKLQDLVKLAVPHMGSKSAIASLFAVSDIELSGNLGDESESKVRMRAKFTHMARVDVVVKVGSVSEKDKRKTEIRKKWEKVSTVVNVVVEDKAKIADQLVTEIMSRHPAIKNLTESAGKEFQKLNGVVEAAIDRAAAYISKRTRCSSHYIADEKECGFAVVRDAKRCGTFTTRSAKDCGHEFVVLASLCGSDRITSVRCGVKRATSGSVCGFDIELASGKKTPRTCNVPKTCDMPKRCLVPAKCEMAKSCKVAKVCKVTKCRKEHETTPSP